MKVVIDPKVLEVLDEFYEKSRQLHCSLTEETCRAKILRLKEAMLAFQKYALMFRKQPYRKDWQAAGYYEFICEKFHFAYKVYKLPDGETVLYFHDAVHGLLNYNPEDKEQSTLRLSTSNQQS